MLAAQTKPENKPLQLSINSQINSLFWKSRLPESGGDDRGFMDGVRGELQLGLTLALVLGHRSAHNEMPPNELEDVELLRC